MTPIMAATLSGNTEIAKFLLSKGVDTKIADEEGYTPLDGAGWVQAFGAH